MNADCLEKHENHVYYVISVSENILLESERFLFYKIGFGSLLLAGVSNRHCPRPTVGLKLPQTPHHITMPMLPLLPSYDTARS